MQSGKRKNRYQKLCSLFDACSADPELERLTGGGLKQQYKDTSGASGNY